MARCNALLGKLWHDIGCLQEAGRAFRDTLPLAQGVILKATLHAYLSLVYAAMRRRDDALQQARAAEALVERGRPLEVEAQPAVLNVLANMCDKLGQEEEVCTYFDRTLALKRASHGDLPLPDVRRVQRRRAQRLLREGRAQEAEAALEPLALLREYFMRIESCLLTVIDNNEYLRSLRVLAEAYGRQGKGEEAARVTADVDETEAISRPTIKAHWSSCKRS